MSKRLWRLATTGAALGTLGTFMCVQITAQDASHITVPFSDGSKPRTVIVKMMNGSITVRGYDGKDAIVETNARASNREHRPPSVPDGMHRIDNTSGGLDITEEGNIVTIHGGLTRMADLVMQVPTQTSLKLETLNGGAIVVENISGEVDAQNMNGAVTINNASGSVVANSMNGKVTVSLTKVTPNKTMSFATMNGEVNVTLPADVKANLKMKTDNGEIYTDFDVKVDASHPPTVENNSKNGGRFHVKVDHAMFGSINGGGPEMQFVTSNGNIVIHKK
jgi:Putative adhesin